MAAVTCLQKILFGPPGCGKSFHVRQIARDELGIASDSPYLIETTFHPEYGYGDFLAKLLPQSKQYQQKYTLSGVDTLKDAVIHEGTIRSTIEYNIHTGPLLKAIALAYANPKQNVLLVIDEINRGNCAQIFGDIFQLLDRNEEGRSEYGVELCQLFRDALITEMARLPASTSPLPAQKLHLPPNLSLIGTMNTSDESVYYMDTAFKRRWDFAFMPWTGQPGSPPHERQRKLLVEDSTTEWETLLERLNRHIAESFKGRNVDDKQIGLWFVKVRQTETERQAPQRQELQTLKSKLPSLIGEAAHAEWVKVFPNVELYGRDGYVKTMSAKDDFLTYGIDWPEDVSPLPSELASTLIAHIDGFLNRPLIRPEIGLETIRNKLMFFLWDNVFARDREPLFRLLRRSGMQGADPRTFGEFSSADHARMLVAGLMLDADPVKAEGE
ncbi:McrB family protein [Massilia sp. BJB1822]|uniref:McrB family protein n=1 Tax=Massilia sp. BJB1822 TaxID=2744470 RepID=UPI0015934AE5|nr:AAA family ATPase [Massilia sp. BJB1822]NVD99403.1 AAA family ATPase [Massilia sp. BJB1822]